MGQTQISVNGVMTDLKDKEQITQIIDDMLEDSTNRLKKLKTNQQKRKERTHIEFFGSINHYLKGGNE